MTPTNDEPSQKNIWLQAILESAAELFARSLPIRTPENSARSLADLLLESDPADPPRPTNDPFKRAGLNLVALVADILDISNIESGHFQLDAVRFDLKRLVSHALANVGPQALQKKLKLRSSIATGIPRSLIGDPVRLQRILTAVLGRAIQATWVGEIALTISADASNQNQLRFEVTNNGTRTQDFEIGPLHKADLEWQLCCALVRLMGGELIASGSLAKGSLFTLHIAFAPGLRDASHSREKDNPEPKTTAAPIAARPAARIVKVLIAEDSEDSRFLLQEFLRNGPYEVTFAENGKIAFETACSDRFDLILMDIQMPVMDGLTATRLIREAERRAGQTPTTLLALTANARKADIELSRAAGCNAHVLKPISRQELLNTIQKYAPLEPVREKPAAGATVAEISIPPGLEEAAKRYIRSKHNDVPRLRDLVAAKEFEQLRIVAHDMKGTGTSYGFPDLTRLGRLMECSAKAENADDLSNQLLELSQYVQAAGEIMAVV